MKLTGKLSLLGGTLFLLVLAVPFFLPAELAIERSIVIGAPAEEAWELVVDLERHPEWHPWDLSDPSPRLVFGETRRGVDASYFWIGGRDNHGTLNYTRVDERYREIDAVVDLSSLGESSVTFRFMPLDTGVEVTELFRKHTGRNLFKRYLHPLYRAAAARQVEANLARLKRAAEGDPPVP